MLLSPWISIPYTHHRRKKWRASYIMLHASLTSYITLSDSRRARTLLNARAWSSILLPCAARRAVPTGNKCVSLRFLCVACSVVNTGQRDRRAWYYTDDGRREVCVIGAVPVMCLLDSSLLGNKVSDYYLVVGKGRNSRPSVRSVVCNR